MRIIRSIASVLLCMLLFAGVVFCGFAYLSSTMLNEEKYSKNLINDEYVNELEAILVDSLETDSLYLDIPIEYILAGLKKEELSAISKDYVKGLIASFKSGAAIPKVEYDSNLFLEQINKYLTDYPEIGAYYEEGTAEEIAQELTNTVNMALNSFINFAPIESIVRSVYTNKIIVLLSRGFYIIIGICVGLIAAIFVLGYKEIWWSLFRVAGSVWCGAVVYAIPIYLIVKKDFLSTIILEKGPFKVLVQGIFDLLCNSWYDLAFALFVAASILLFTAIVLVAIFSSKEKQLVENEKD